MHMTLICSAFIKQQQIVGEGQACRLPDPIFAVSGFGGMMDPHHTLPYALKMPLPAPDCPRERAHTRRIVIEGYLRRDGLLELDAMLEDVKDEDYPLASGLRPGGDPVHRMWVRVALDDEFTIVQAESCSDWVPYFGYCDTIGPAYGKLIGLNLVRGFRRTVTEMFGSVSGCTHVTELLMSLPTAAIQTYATFRRDSHDEQNEKPFQLDRCHALETNAPAVERYYPRWYRRKG